MSETPLIYIEDLSVSPQTDGRLRGAWIDAPRRGDVSEIYSIDICGWCVGGSSPAVGVELYHYDAFVGRVPIILDRRDVVAAFPNAPLKSGFHASLNLLSLPARTQLYLQAVLEDETRAPIAVLTWRRQPVLTESKSGLHPLLVTTLGRTGSSWVMRVLAEHPQITAYRPFDFEPRFVGLWTTLFRSVSEPFCYSRALTGNLDDSHWWRAATEGSLGFSIRAQDRPIREVLGRRNVEKTAAFVTERLEDFYQEVARGQGKSNVKFFAEKSFPSAFVSNVISELFPGAKEVILIRDFRDVICSILAFNSKRGYPAFGRQTAGSDEEFVRGFRDHALRMRTHFRGRRKSAHLLRYEDFITQPEITLRALLEYLEIDASDPTVQHTLQAAAAADPESQRAHSTSKNAAASIGRWRTDLSRELKDESNKALGDILAEFGYSI